MDSPLRKKPKIDLVKLKKIKEEKKKIKRERLVKKAQQTSIEPSLGEDAVDNSRPESAAAALRTVSIAVPGSILDNAQSRELRTYLAGQVARAACIFEVDEVIVYDDMGSVDTSRKVEVDEELYGVKSVRKCCAQLARILQYLECPQYLRKSFFPVHDDLQYAGLLNPLDAPHHLRQTDDFTYREGVVSNLPAKAGCSSVNVGLFKEIIVKKELARGIRVTVKLLPKKEGSKKQYGEVVAPTRPRADTGVYWGYVVRIASSLSEVFCQAPYPGGYDLTVGTSDKGTNVDGLPAGGLSQHKHVLIVFGGLHGLEAAVENDEKLTADEPALLFDHYVNTCPGQGSRTIRTEEAILISLTVFRSKFFLCVNKDNFRHVKN